MVTRSPHKRLLIAAALVLGLFAFAPGTASAQFYEDPQLMIGGTTSTGGDPVRIGSDGVVTVTQVDNGQPSPDTPWTLIVGLVKPVGALPTITMVNGAPNNMGLASGPTDTGLALTGSSTGGVYHVLAPVLGAAASSITKANDSNTFGNWQGADSTYNNINVNSTTGFELITYSISVPLPGQTTDTFQFSGLPVGSYVVAFGTNVGGGGNTKVYDSPFTNAGLETGETHFFSTPEPSTMALALSGLVGAGFAGLRRLRRTRAATV